MQFIEIQEGIGSGHAICQNTSFIALDEKHYDVTNIQ